MGAEKTVYCRDCQNFIPAEKPFQHVDPGLCEIYSKTKRDRQALIKKLGGDSFKPKTARVCYEYVSKY